MWTECGELRRLLDDPPMEEYGINRTVFAERLAALPGVDGCIVDGLRDAAVAEDWDSFGQYLWAAYLRPAREMTPVLVEALHRRNRMVPHEGIVDLLIDLADPDAFGALREMLWWNPEWDDAHAIAVKAAYALAELPGAEPVLREAAERGPGEVREAAATILDNQPDSCPVSAGGPADRRTPPGQGRPVSGSTDASAETFERQIERTLVADDPFATLRSLVIDRRRHGVGREDLYKALTAVMLRLRDEGREPEENIVLDVMDQLVGWCSPQVRID